MLLLRKLLLHLMLVLLLLMLLLLLSSYLSNSGHLRCHGALLWRRRGEDGRVSRSGLLLCEGAKHILLLLQLKLLQGLVKSGATQKQIGLLLLGRRSRCGRSDCRRLPGWRLRGRGLLLLLM